MQKPHQGDQLIHQWYTKIKLVTVKIHVSFQCQVKIREGQDKETAWSYGWNR